MQEKQQLRDSEATSLARQIALMQAQLREAQRAGAAAAEAQAAVSKAMEGQAAEVAALRQKLRDAEVRRGGAGAIDGWLAPQVHGP